jgi:NAD(P)-dependent dehydrogenase (short-subunit alcohol dehydrogenase family)
MRTHTGRLERREVSVALVTGGSRGLGKALTRGLLSRGWSVVTDARGSSELGAAAAELRAGLSPGAVLIARAGDVTDAAHRDALMRSAADLGGLDLVVNNAGILGPSPQPALVDYPVEWLSEVFAANTIAPLAIVQGALPLLRGSLNPRVLNITSDAAIEAYAGWGGYGSSKAALEQLGRVLAMEEPWLRVWSVDPGDMATQMHQEAFPGENISDRPPPAGAAKTLIHLVESNQPSGRYAAADFTTWTHK